MSSRGEIAPVPALDVLATDPARALGLSAPERAVLIGRCAAILAALSATPPDDSKRSPSGAVEDPDVWLTVPEVADRLRLAKSYVYQLARRGDLPVIRTGKYIRVRLIDLRTWAARLASGPLEPGRYLTYHRTSEGRRASAHSQATRADAGPARGAGRGNPQHDRPARAQRNGDRRAARPAAPARSEDAGSDTP